MTLGERLIRLRQDKNIKQIDAAKDLRISNVVLNRYEKDERVPDKDMLKTIADYYVCSLDFLLGRTDYRTYPHIQAAHTDYAFTANTYTHPEVEALRAAVNKA